MPNPEIPNQDDQLLPKDVIRSLRALSHQLSNSLETILHAGYLLEQMELSPHAGKWAQLIAKATEDAARINHEIRAVLHSQPESETEHLKPGA